jgi:WD40 repeat protein
VKYTILHLVKRSRPHSDEGIIKRWNAVTGELIHDFAGNQGQITSMSFSPDGEAIAFSTGNPIKLWSVATGEPLHTLERHQGSVDDVKCRTTDIPHHIRLAE